MKIYRKRYIPNEIIDISSDEVVFHDDEKLITRWNPIHTREDIGRGESCVFFKQGWKISKFYRKDGSFKFWYCDIISYEYDKTEDTYIINDLLLDVIIHMDGRVEVLDEDELEEALRDGIITDEIAIEAKQKLQSLLRVIEEGKFDELKF